MTARSPPAPALTSATAAMSTADINVEVARLRAALMRENPAAIPASITSEQAWATRTRAALETSGIAIDKPQLVVVVDRNPLVQQLAILVASPDGVSALIGSSMVSTGQSGRRGYFQSPTGVFPHTDAILDYRADGTFNANHIRGLGARGMRVWDFGWQQAPKGWLIDGEKGEMRLLLHATDPDVLERRLGRPASMGCVRVSAAMNRFLDRHGVLDADYEKAAAEDRAYAAVLRSDRAPSPLAGRTLVIIDSSK